MKKILILSSAVMLTALAASARECDITVSNPSDRDRCEVVATAEFPSGNFRLLDEDGKEVPCQITRDGRLIFRADVRAGATSGYFFGQGTPASPDTVCYGRIFPERKDDLAWENDRSAYRAYGPALQASGEKAYGYDVWTKSVAYPVLEKRFYDDIVNKISFHVDHGNGMDVYAVGPTLGGGTSAILAEGDSIVYPCCWAEAEVIENGPLRFSARLKYPPCVVDGDTIVETRLITLDAGDPLNRTVVTYEGLRAPLRPMAGIVVHDSNPRGFTMADGVVTCCDLTQNPDAGNGEIYLALYAPDGAEAKYIPLTPPAGDAVGHVTLTGKTGCPNFTYYWGSGWSKGGIRDHAAWQKTVAEFAENLANPLIVKNNTDTKK